MSTYIYTHPKEALEEEMIVIVNTFERRKLSYGVLYYLTFRAVIVYIYRRLRLWMKPR